MLALAEALLRLRWRPLASGAVLGSLGIAAVGFAVDGFRSEDPVTLGAMGALLGVAVASVSLAGIDQMEARMALFSRLPLPVAQAVTVRQLAAVVPILIVGALSLLAVAIADPAEERFRGFLFLTLLLILGAGLRLLWGELGVRYRELWWVRWILLLAAPLGGFLVGSVFGVVVGRSIAMVALGGSGLSAALVLAWSWWLAVHRENYLQN